MRKDMTDKERKEFEEDFSKFLAQLAENQRKDERNEFLLNLGIMACTGLLLLSACIWFGYQFFGV